MPGKFKMKLRTNKCPQFLNFVLRVLLIQYKWQPLSKFRQFSVCLPLDHFAGETGIRINICDLDEVDSRLQMRGFELQDILV